MVAGPDRHLVAVEDGRQVVGVDALDGEGDHHRPLDAGALNRLGRGASLEGLDCVLGDLALVRADRPSSPSVSGVEGGTPRPIT